MPTMVMTIAITIATIGRLMKNFGTDYYLGCDFFSSFATGCSTELAGPVFSEGRVHGFATTGVPALIFCKPSTTTFSPGFTPDVITQSLPDTWADLHRPNLCFPICADNAELITALHFVNRALRHYDRVFQNLCDDSRAREESWPQDAPRIRKQPGDQNCTGRCFLLQIDR